MFRNFSPVIFSKLEGNFPYMTQYLGTLRFTTVSMVCENHKSDTYHVEVMASSDGGVKRIKQEFQVVTIFYFSYSVMGA